MLERARKTVSANSQVLSQHPKALTQMLASAMLLDRGVKLVTVCGRGDDPGALDMCKTVNIQYLPDVVVQFLKSDATT